MQLKGHVDEISRRRIAGWAVDMDNPLEPVSVSIIVNGNERGRIKAEAYRPNLKESLGEGATGHHAFRFEFEPTLSRFGEHRVEVKFAQHNQLVSNGSKLLPRPTQAESPLLPVILTSVGRSGSTLMMSELARHPEIVADAAYPFEVKLVAYYSAAFDVLVATQDRVNSTDPATMFGVGNGARIGHNPYNSPEKYQGPKRAKLSEFFLRQVPDAYSALFHQLILKYYDVLRVEQKKHSARFFAEKGELDEVAREGARLFFGEVREIVVVRDPRDLLCSATAFWKLPRAEAFERLQTTLPRLEQIYRSLSSDIHFVRYEDLIRRPTETWRGIYEFIGVAPVTSAAGNDTGDLFRMHGTSGDPEASIGRWRQDLPAEEIEKCQGVFPAFMQRFGYTGNGVTDGWLAEPGPTTPAAEIAKAAAPAIAVEPEHVAASTEAGTTLAPVEAALSLPDLLICFESLGENCEFGLVQRHCGAEPVGLLRFASAPLSKLLPALETRFRGVDDPSGVRVELSANGREYMVDDGQFGLHYHAWVLAGEMPPEDIRQREIKQLPLLVRKLIDDLTTGQKIFVYHGMKPLSEAEVLSLAAALRTYGGGTLLWIELADSQHPPGSVDWVADNVLKGRLDRFAPEEDAHDLSLSCWIAICREAYRLWRERQAEKPAATEATPTFQAVSSEPLRPAPPDPTEFAAGAPGRVQLATAAPAAEPARQVEAGPEPELKPQELMMRFESLGENCELGLVQRRCGAEPLGLFRFASAPLSNLLPVLEARFEGFGAPDNLAVELSSNGREYMVADRKFGFLYHAWVLADEMRPEEIHQREARRLPLLIRKLIEDLTAGRKLLVVRGMDQSLDKAKIDRLLAGLRRYGPNTLLWVELADADHRPGTVDWIGSDLLKGYIDRFAPGEDAHDLSLDCWVAICRAAERLWRRRGAGAAVAAE